MPKKFIKVVGRSYLFWFLLSLLLPLPLWVMTFFKVSQLAAAPVITIQPGLTSLAKPIAVTKKTSPLPVQFPNRLEISLNRRQVALYRSNSLIRRYPIAIGRAGWDTPTGTFKIRQMQENPTWINPLTDAVIPGGDPDNPLGSYWIGFWTDGRNWIGFHGTPQPHTVGKAVSHGCIRMYNDDISELFNQVSPGMPVIVKK